MAIGKEIKLIVGVILIILISAVVYKANASPRLTAEEKSKIITSVNAYYNYMMIKEYESALKLVDITTSDYEKTILTLNNEDYSVKKSLEGESWIIPSNGRDDVYYDKESKSFYTQTGALIIYKTDSFEATENVYVQKLGDDFKITKITTDDRFSYIRGTFARR